MKKLEQKLSDKEAENARLKEHQQDLIDLLEQKPDQSKMTQTMIFSQTPEDAAKDKRIRELNRQLTAKRQDNELLQAEVDESNYWVYERGPVKQELIELREGSVTKDREIAKLERENSRLKADLKRAQAVVADAGRRHSPHAVGHPSPERASINQHFINNLFDRAKQAG